MPKGTTILRPGSCTNWVKCPSTEDESDFEEGSCLFGLYYDKDSGRCDLAARVQCPYENKPTKGRCENVEEATFLEDYESCNSYIFCKKGAELHADCPSDLVFDPRKSSCVYKQDYKCPTKTDKPTTDPICLSVSDRAHFADELDCTKYHQCTKGIIATQSCNEGNVFDHNKGQCIIDTDAVCIPTAVEPEPIVSICGTADNAMVGYFSDQESCSGYYICKPVEGGVDREPVFAKCPNGFFFDSDKLSCRDRLNVQCQLDRCEGMGNKYVNINGDCTSYARCQNNVAISTGKCPEKYFFDEKTQGCTPQNIHYAACT